MKNRIMELRLKSKIRKYEMCKLLDISEKTLYNYEHDRLPIPSDVLIRIAELYTVSTDYILGLSQYTSISVVDESDNVLAVITGNEIVEHTGYRVILSNG